MKRGELPVKTVYGYRKINNELTIFDNVKSINLYLPAIGIGATGL